ncbi:MAG: GIY-YIG nuclease family protein [Bacteroidetes bacterium]|nr:GIY-YIG nuclease family protein [Bacteroidota bacterium]
MKYYVYITTNPRRTVLYTGVTNNLKRRIAEHHHAKGQPTTFAGRYYCYVLVWYQVLSSRSDAILLEKQIKGWTRRKKALLIESVNPDWQEIVL